MVSIFGESRDQPDNTLRLTPIRNPSIAELLVALRASAQALTPRGLCPRALTRAGSDPIGL